MGTAMNGFRRTGLYQTVMCLGTSTKFDSSLFIYIPEDHTSSMTGLTLSSLSQASSAIAHASVEQTPSAVVQTLPSLGNTSSAVAHTSAQQTSSPMEQTLPSLGNTSSAVAHTSAQQTSSPMEQTFPSLGQTLSSTGHGTQSLTSSNRATYVLANRRFQNRHVRICRRRRPKWGNQRRVRRWHQKRRTFRLDAKTAGFIATSSSKTHQTTTVSGAPWVSAGDTTSVQE